MRFEEFPRFEEQFRVHPGCWGANNLGNVKTKMAINATGEEETVSGAPQISGTLWGAPTFGNVPQTAPELVGEEERVGEHPKRASSRKVLCGYPP